MRIIHELLNLTVQTMEFSIEEKFPADFVTFTEEILNGNLQFLCAVQIYCTYCLPQFIITN